MRWLITLGLVLIVVLNLAILRLRFLDFLTNESQDFAVQLGHELANVDPALSGQAAGMFSRLVPVYGDALVAAYDRHRPAVIANTHTELARLDQYAQQRWPLIEQQLAEMLVAQEAVIHTRLKDVVTEEEAETISQLYGKAIMDRVTALMDQELKPHRESAENIGANLALLLESEPAPDHPVESREIVGLTLELAGIGMQQPL